MTHQAPSPKYFYACNNLATVTIGSGLTTLGDSVFRNCTSLTTIRIPSSVTSIGDSAFNGCSILEYASFGGDAPTTFGLNVFDNTKAGFGIYYDGGANWTNPFHGYPASQD